MGVKSCQVFGAGGKQSVELRSRSKRVDSNGQTKPYR